MDYLALLTSASVLGTVMVFITALFWSLSASPRAQERARLEGLMRGTSVVETPVALRAARRRAPLMFGALMKTPWGERVQEELDRADAGMTSGEFLVLRICATTLGFAAPYVVLGPTPIGLLGALGGAVVGYKLPVFWLKRKLSQRIAALERQLPDTLTLVSNSLKAGFGLLQSLSLAADQTEHPISTELARAIYEMNMGSSTEEALLGLSERSGSKDMDIVVTAILVQRTVGGNLGEILDTVASTMRERARIRQEVQTLTAQQKLTGVVIGLLPLGVAGLFLVLSPGYITPLFTTVIGKTMIAMAVVMESIGLLIIRRILDIEV